MRRQPDNHPTRRPRDRALLARALGLGLAVFAAGASLGEEVTIDGVAAQVGSDVVLMSEVYRRAAPIAQQVRAQGGSAEDLALVHNQTLDQLIERALVRQVVERAELAASDSEVDSAIEAIATENNISIDQLRRSVEAQGLPYQEYREKIRDEIEQSKVISAMVTSRIRVDEGEIREIYEAEYAGREASGLEVHLRQILVPSAAAPDACDQVTQARDRIVAGESFELVASQVSYTNPQEGGDLGWTPLEDLAPWMREIAEDLPTGAMSGVIELQHACTLLVVEERRDASKRSFSDVREEIRERLRNERMEGRYREFIDDMRERTYIDRRAVFDPRDFERAGSASATTLF